MVKANLQNILLGAFLVLGSMLFIYTGQAGALSGSDFNRANIIDDTVFFDEGTMSVSQIQSFLVAKVPSCDTNGTQIYSGSTTRAQYGTSKGNPPPYICLKNYSQSIPSVSANSYCTGISGGTFAAARIIYYVSRACNINPQTLIVLLQKEQSLVTDDWPWPVQYQKATGYGCPDTAPCDSQYYGFFNQVYNAAKQFNRYVELPDDYNYAAGRTSFIAYHPNAGCGGTNVTIQNGATAALYNYTPYQPNSAALNNLYGTGNSCSAYGNRNFWRMFNDWFGPTSGSYLVRTTSDSTVYLISDDNKYPIPNRETMNALYPLGASVKYVSSAYLSGKTTQPLLKRLIKGPGSTIYFFDAGIKLRFGSCTQIEHYGMTCSDAATLTQLQIDKFATGPDMPYVMHTTSGKWFYMQGGEKHEATGTQALTDNSLSTTNVKLYESSLAYLGLGTPIVSPNSVMISRGSGNKYLYSDSKRFLVPSSLRTLSFLSNMKKGYLDAASIVKFTNIAFNGFLTAGSTKYLLDNQGKVTLQTPSDWSSSFTTVPSQLLSSIPSSSTSTSAEKTYKGSGSAIYRIFGAAKAPFPSWTDLKLYSSGSPSITTIPQYYINTLASTRPQYGPTRLIKASNSTTVYMVDGTGNKRTVGAFSQVRAAGIKFSVLTISSSNLSQYTTIGSVDHRIKCGSTYYLATGGNLRMISLSMRQEYGFADGSFASYQANTCAGLPKGNDYIARYIKSDNSNTIYYVENGTKRPFTSYSSYTSHGGASYNTLKIEKSLIVLIATGASI
jgi:hypothetical protein